MAEGKDQRVKTSCGLFHTFCKWKSPGSFGVETSCLTEEDYHTIPSAIPSLVCVSHVIKAMCVLIQQDPVWGGLILELCLLVVIIYTIGQFIWSTNGALLDLQYMVVVMVGTWGRCVSVYLCTHTVMSTVHCSTLCI